MNSMKVSSRLAWSFGTLIAFFLAIALLSLSRLSDLNAATESLAGDRAPKLAALNDIAYRTMDNARIVRNVILLTDEPKMAANMAVFNNNIAAIEEQYAFLQKRVNLEQGKRMLAEMAAHRDAYMAYTAEVIKLGLLNKNDEATQILFGEKYKTQAAYFESIRKFIDFQVALQNAAATEAASLFGWARGIIIGLSALACGVSGLLALLVSRRLILQLGGEPGELVAAANAIAAGDLSRSIARRDTAEGSAVAAMETMQRSLRRLVGQVRQSSDSIATGSAEIAIGNADLSQRTEEQASNLQQTAASMEQLSGNVKASADNAAHASELAARASAAAARGGALVGHVVNTMQDITASSKKISEIIGVIDGIAFQTNILALNAAVEAARAGEQGRGFAVVASEVRSLAGRSAEAAKEIKSLIGASVEKVDAGSRQVDDAGLSMNEIVTQVQQVSQLIGEISNASKEQALGVSQVGEAVTQLDQVTQQNAALVEQSAAAAESLKQQAAALAEVVRVFRIVESDAVASAV